MKRTTGTNALTERLAALSEMIRLRILRLLEREELSVGEVARVVQLPQSTVSRHLKVLSDGPGGGWLAKRTEGTATLYRLVLDDLPQEARSLWIAVRDQMEHSSELAQDNRRLEAVLADRRSDSQAFFGRVAGQWDEVRTDLFGEEVTTAGLLAFVDPGWTVADLGCGTGNAAEVLAPLVARVIAVDQSGPMLTAAKKRLRGVENVEFVRAPLEDLPLESASVDAAVCVLVLHHVEEPGSALAEMRRVLKPGGVGLVVEMVEHERDTYRHTMGHRWLGFSEERITGLMGEAGFGTPRYVELRSDRDAKGPALFACRGVAGGQKN